MNEKIFKELIGIFNENLELDSEITMNLDDDLSKFIKDSITFIKIIVGIETFYDIEFSDQELELDQFTDVQSLIDHIIEKI